MGAPDAPTLDLYGGDPVLRGKNVRKILQLAFSSPIKDYGAGSSAFPPDVTGAWLKVRQALSIGLGVPDFRADRDAEICQRVLAPIMAEWIYRAAFTRSTHPVARLLSPLPGTEDVLVNGARLVRGPTATRHGAGSYQAKRQRQPASFVSVYSP